jgi:hypothetical protein
MLLFAAASNAGERAVPPFIAVGFDQYARYGPEAAWSAWKIDYGEKQAEKKASFLDAAYGKALRQDGRVRTGLCQ